MNITNVILVIVLLGIMQQAHATEQSDLAKQAQNPIANLISLPLQNNTNFNVGPDDRTQNILNIQPVYPFSLGEDWNLITRTILPVYVTATGRWGSKKRIGRHQLLGVLLTERFRKTDLGCWTGVADSNFHR